jgi:uncharacterized protein
LSSRWLLDTNVLLAWLWPAHEAHKAAAEWMRSNHEDGWSTCALTQISFLRILTNRSFSPHAPTWRDAIEVLRKHTEGNPLHSFWKHSLTLIEVDVLFGSRIKGPNQIMDACLLALAMNHDARLVTFDLRMTALVSADSKEADALLILRP